MTRFIFVSLPPRYIATVSSSSRRSKFTTTTSSIRASVAVLSSSLLFPATAVGFGDRASISTVNGARRRRTRARGAATKGFFGRHQGLFQGLVGLSHPGELPLFFGNRIFNLHHCNFECLQTFPHAFLKVNLEIHCLFKLIKKKFRLTSSVGVNKCSTLEPEFVDPDIVNVDVLMRSL